MGLESDQQGIPELSFDELFSGEIPNIRSQAFTITQEEIDGHMRYLASHGVVITQEGDWINSGFRSEDGRLVMNLPHASHAAKLHESIHIQHMLEAKKEGVQSQAIIRCLPNQKALDEILASTATIAFLTRTGGNDREIRLEQINIDLSLKQLQEQGIDDVLRHFGVDSIKSIAVNPYLWRL